MCDSEQASLEILEEWIAGRGKQPVTWNTLIEVLHEIELGMLAREIEAVKLPEGEYLETMLLECGNSDADSEGSVDEDSDQSDGGEIHAELITDIELSTLATEIEAVKLPLEDRHTEDTEDSNQRATGIIEDFKYEEAVSVTDTDISVNINPELGLNFGENISEFEVPEQEQTNEANTSSGKIGRTKEEEGCLD